jgi:hypothetical protein
MEIHGRADVGKRCAVHGGVECSVGGGYHLERYSSNGRHKFHATAPHVDVTLFEATSTQPTVLGEATTNASGQFSITSPRNTSSSIFYVSADIRGGVEFLSILGPNLPATVTINELTTVAASYSMAQFYKTGVISGNSFGLQIAAGMNDNIVRTRTGESSFVLLFSPNADQSNSLRSTRSLANLLAACVHDRSVTARFLARAKQPRGPAPRTTAQALANLTRNPWQNVDAIYALTRLSSSYEPTLERMPDAWTVTVKVNDTGDDGHLYCRAWQSGIRFQRICLDHQ